MVVMPQPHLWLYADTEVGPEGPTDAEVCMPIEEWRKPEHREVMHKILDVFLDNVEAHEQDRARLADAQRRLGHEVDAAPTLFRVVVCDDHTK